MLVQIYRTEGKDPIHSEIVTGPMLGEAVGVAFVHAVASGVNTEEVQLISADISKADLRGARMPRGYFLFTVARGTQFNRANLAGAFMSAMDLEGADFTGADLRGVDFTGAKLHGAKFDFADIRGAKFSGADMEGVDISYARRN